MNLLCFSMYADEVIRPRHAFPKLSTRFTAMNANTYLIYHEYPVIRAYSETPKNLYKYYLQIKRQYEK